MTEADLEEDHRVTLSIEITPTEAPEKTLREIVFGLTPGVYIAPIMSEIDDDLLPIQVLASEFEDVTQLADFLDMVVTGLRQAAETKDDEDA